MADTRWEDPANWTYADCSDDTKQPLISHLWDTWKGAADERVAFAESSHDSGFPAADTFPDWNADKSAILMGANTPKNAQRIENAIYPMSAVETDTISESGTVSAADIPENLSLSDLLTGPLGYASGDLLHMTETDDGNQNAIFQMTWFKQWFEVMDYPEYYNQLIRTSPPSSDPGPEITDIEFQFVEGDLWYSYNNNNNTFIGATMYVKSPRTTSTTTDVYVTNDLNETSPFSTVTACRDYCITSFNTERDLDNWWTGLTDESQQEIWTELTYNIRYGTVGGGNADQIEIDVLIQHKRIRFKVSDAYRALSPGRYTVPIKWNGYYRINPTGYTCPANGVGGTNTCTDNWSDFGTGETEDEVVFVTLTADGSDYYYLEIDSPDYTVPPVPVVPPQFDQTIDRYSMWRYSLTVDQTTITQVLHSIYFNPNTTDGLNFEFYTPAP